MLEGTASRKKPDPSGANLDQREVDQFARQADDWWDPNGPFRPLHQIGPIRLKYIRESTISRLEIVEPGLRPLHGLNCLDVGCGGGLITEPLSRMGGIVTAIDPAKENIATAAAHAQAGGLSIDYRAVTAEQLVEEGLTFDLVTCLEVIEHVPKPAEFVDNLAKLVRPGGLLVMSTINRTPKSYALAIIGAEYILRWLPVGTHQWERFVQPAELKKFMGSAGLDQFGAMGVVYNPFKDEWSLSDDTAVNYMACAIKQA